MSKSIPVEMIEDGMELAEPIKNKYGQIMLAENAKLESKQKKMLKVWGISSVIIVADDEPFEHKAYDPEIIEKAKIKLSEKILWQPGNQFEEEIYQLALERILENHFS
ncbi:MAG: hypothetical protein NTX65_13150 [Ignavibacteriales bacterium]|nr:hypothetical protein [Ignavibacteriales bacterium]